MHIIKHPHFLFFVFAISVIFMLGALFYVISIQLSNAPTDVNVPRTVTSEPFVPNHIIQNISLSTHGQGYDLNYTCNDTNTTHTCWSKYLDNVEVSLNNYCNYETTPQEYEPKINWEVVYSNDSYHHGSINFSNNFSASITLPDYCKEPIITDDSVTCICSNETLTIYFDDLGSYMLNPQDDTPFNPNDWICYENNTEIICPDPETIDHFKRDIIYLIK